MWTDYAYDDAGVNASAGTDGTETYPEPLSNAVDLIQLQLKPSGQGTVVTAVLETLLDPGVPQLGVGIDTGIYSGNRCAVPRDLLELSRLRDQRSRDDPQQSLRCNHRPFPDVGDTERAGQALDLWRRFAGVHACPAAWPGDVAVTRDGTEVGRLTPSGGRIVLADDFSGDHTYVLSAVGDSPATSVGPVARFDERASSHGGAEPAPRGMGAWGSCGCGCPAAHRSRAAIAHVERPRAGSPGGRVAGPAIISTSDRYLDHDVCGGHPERPARLDHVVRGRRRPGAQGTSLADGLSFWFDVVEPGGPPPSRPQRLRSRPGQVLGTCTIERRGSGMSR